MPFFFLKNIEINIRHQYLTNRSIHVKNSAFKESDFQL